MRIKKLILGCLSMGIILQSGLTSVTAQQTNIIEVSAESIATAKELSEQSQAKAPAFCRGFRDRNKLAPATLLVWRSPELQKRIIIAKIQ